MKEIIKRDIVLLKNPLVMVSVFLFVIVGFSSGMYYKSSDFGANEESQQIRVGVGEFTNPLLECEVTKNSINSTIVFFDSQLKNLVKDIISRENLTHISLYFRDLNNGPVIGINEDEIFMPASLLKVPVMMSYLKHSETDPSIFSQKIYYKSDQKIEFEQIFPPEVKLEENKEYSVTDLIDRMIKYSDNQALAILWPYISMEEYAKLYNALGVDSKSLLEKNHGLTVKEYSRFFRILYNSSYLSQSNSEKALKTLSQTKFTEGIRKNMPKDIVVASKFGEIGIDEQIKQIHECGIVYYPNHPYLICIMTRGPNPKYLTKSISEISDFVFSEVKKQYTKVSPDQVR